MNKKTFFILVFFGILHILFCMPQPNNKTDIRTMIVGIDSEIILADGTKTPAINFDNAATTPAFIQVVEDVIEKLAFYGSIGRGKGQKSEFSTAIFEQGRQKVLDFVGASPEKYTAIYVNNTTDGFNKLATALITSPEDIVLLSRMEHHANDLIWRHLCKTIYAAVDEKGRLILEDVERLLREHDGAVKFVSVSAASNVTGYVNDVHSIARIAHQYGAEIIVDGAQIVAHRAFNMHGANENEDIDYFIFSAHKMYAPFGSGAVIGVTERLNQHTPRFYGGGMVDVVTDDVETYLKAPERYESGTPNYLGVVAMLKAIDILKTEIGFEYIKEHEQLLLRKTIDGLKAIHGVTLYDDTNDISDKVGIVVFNIDGINSGDVAQMFADRSGIAVRQGAFCSHPYVFRLLGIPDEEIAQRMREPNFTMPGMVRVSFGVYNNEEEVDIFLQTVMEIISEL
ncbi:MAG: aminotransferase class V-fold PLP-dependent enzyme [Candidatus Cloacimonetes bacterium]|nr:aminotransferase class V-fold PLP-dependent enzyme [Candidatus Cloacimonadota bacterium]